MSDSHGSYVDSSSAAEQVEDYSEYMPPDITLQPPTQGKTKPKNTKKSNNKSARSKKVEKKEGHKYPAVLLLGGSAFVATKSQVLVDKILSSIEKRISSSSPLNLLGRTTKYYRIYYDPAAQGVTGIKSRMTKLMSTEHCYSTGDYESLELLLSPLVRGNWKAFRDIHIKQLATKSRLLQATYCSQWTFHLRALRKVTPTSWSKRHRVILMVVRTVRKRCERVNPSSALLRDRWILQMRWRRSRRGLSTRTTQKRTMTTRRKA